MSGAPGTSADPAVHSAAAAPEGAPASELRLPAVSARDAKTMVVKIGSSTLVKPDGMPDRAFLDGLARQGAHLRAMGWNLVIVSSGAIACGLRLLGYTARPTDMPTLQAAASVGQLTFARAYDEALWGERLLSSLVLLTRQDTAQRSSYLHARDTLMRLVELGVVPVVNENDTVTVDQIRFGDNDTLAALVACLVAADLCVTLSDVDGLYTANPLHDASAALIPRVEKIDAAIIEAAGDVGSAVGTGGMVTKVRASRILMTAGIPSVICSGGEVDPLVRLAAGEAVGTVFDPPAARRDIAPRKLWIALGDTVHGALVIDEGAAHALERRGSSLLPVGVREVVGEFEAGEILDVKDPSGFTLARGIAEADSDTLRLAAGRHQDEIAGNRLLSSLANRPAIHRDNMIVFA